MEIVKLGGLAVAPSPPASMPVAPPPPASNPAPPPPFVAPPPLPACPPSPPPPVEPDVLSPFVPDPVLGWAPPLPGGPLRLSAPQAKSQAAAKRRTVASPEARRKSLKRTPHYEATHHE